MNQRFLSLVLLVHCLLPLSAAWTTGLPQHQQRKSRLFMSVESVSVESLGEDHEKVGSELSGSVQRWLDAEWMPQDTHVRMGESCKKTYVDCRSKGEADLMAIMMQTADDLQEKWDEYDAEAFVNAYDVANYVSDFLTVRAVGEGCECASKIH